MESLLHPLAFGYGLPFPNVSVHREGVRPCSLSLQHHKPGQVRRQLCLNSTRKSNSSINKKDSSSNSSSTGPTSIDEGVATKYWSGGRKKSSRNATLARKMERAAAMLEFEAQVKATTERGQLKAVIEKYAPSKRRLTGSEIVLVCNQMAKLCDPQNMPWKAWKEMQVRCEVRGVREALA